MGTAPFPSGGGQGASLSARQITWTPTHTGALEQGNDTCKCWLLSYTAARWLSRWSGLCTTSRQAVALAYSIWVAQHYWAGWRMMDVAGDRRFPIAGCRELRLLRSCLSGGRCRPKGRAKRSRPPPSCHRSATRNLFGQAAGGIRKGRPWAARQAPPSSQLPRSKHT